MGGGTLWYHEKDGQYEYGLMESLILTTLIIITFIFEKFHHSLYHKIGHLKKHSHGHHDQEEHASLKELAEVSGESFMLQILKRIDSECMILGVLALTVWSCNQLHLFDKFTAANHYGDHIGPWDGASLLHLVENVHMTLFLAVLLYFTVMCYVVHTVQSRVEEFELFEQILASKRPGNVDERRATIDVAKVNEMLSTPQQVNLKAYSLIREYFIQHVEMPKATEQDDSAPPGAIRPSFHFSRFIRAATEDLMEELVQVNGTVWMLMVVLYLLYGFIGYYTHMTDFELQYFGMGVTAVGFQIIVTIGLTSQLKYEDIIHDRVQSGGFSADEVLKLKEGNAVFDGYRRASGWKRTDPKKEAGFNHLTAIRALQSFAFFGAFWMINYLLNRDRYRDMTVWDVCEISLLLGCSFFFALCILPQMCFRFVVVMSVPPHVTDTEKIHASMVSMEFPHGCVPNRKLTMALARRASASVPPMNDAAGGPQEVGVPIAPSMDGGRAAVMDSVDALLLSEEASARHQASTEAELSDEVELLRDALARVEHVRSMAEAALRERQQHDHDSG